MKRRALVAPPTTGLRAYLLTRRRARFERDYGRGFECDRDASVRHVDRGEYCGRCEWPEHRFWRYLLARMDAEAADVDALADRSAPVVFQACEVRLDGLLPHGPGSGWWWYRLERDDSLTAFRARP